jgi:hypothetical protein
MKAVIAPDFENLLPEQSPLELAELEQNVAADRHHELFPPVIVWSNHHNTIIDGHHQYKFRLKHNCKVKFAKKEFASRDDAMLYAIGIQFGRRNLSASQRAAIVSDKLPKLTPVGVGGENSPPPTSYRSAAKVAGVDKKTMRDAAVVNHRADDEVKQAVKDGDVSVSDAAKIVHQPKAKQQEAVKQVKAGNARTLQAAVDKPRPSGKQVHDPRVWESWESNFGKLMRLTDDLHKQKPDVHQRDAIHKLLGKALELFSEWRTNK